MSILQVVRPVLRLWSWIRLPRNCSSIRVAAKGSPNPYNFIILTGRAPNATHETQGVISEGYRSDVQGAGVFPARRVAQHPRQGSDLYAGVEIASLRSQ